MYVKAMHPRVPHQLWEVPAGATIKYGVATPLVPADQADATDSEFMWSKVLTREAIPTLEVWVHGDPDVYGDPMPADSGVTMTGNVPWLAQPNTGTSGHMTPDQARNARYFIKWVSWWDPTRNVDVTVITGSEGDLFLMGDNGRTLDKVA